MQKWKGTRMGITTMMLEVQPQSGALDPAPIFSRCGVDKPPRDVL